MYSRQDSNLQPLHSRWSIRPIGMLLYFLSKNFLKKCPCCISQGSLVSSFLQLFISTHFPPDDEHYFPSHQLCCLYFLFVLCWSTQIQNELPVPPVKISSHTFLCFLLSITGIKKARSFVATGLHSCRYILYLLMIIPRSFIITIITFICYGHNTPCCRCIPIASAWW